MNVRKLLVASFAVSAALFAGASQARTDWSIHIGLPPLLLPPLPGVVVTTQPRVVYEEPRGYYPAPGGYYPAPPAYYPAAPAYYRAPRGYYPAPRPVYGDRDHDGVPNRWDRVDNRRYGDRDHDGVPDWRDRNDGRRVDNDRGRGHGQDRPDDRDDRRHHW